MKCPNCHKDIDRPLPFCPSCGTPLDGSENHNQTTVNVNPNPGPQMPQPAKPAVNAKKQLLIILGAVVAIAIIINMFRVSENIDVRDANKLKH